MTGWRVTYEVTSPDGEELDSGFIDPEGWRTNTIVGVPTPGVEMSLRNALRFVVPQCDDGRWFSEVDSTIDFVSGAHKRCALHPPANITPSSYERVARLLDVD